MSASIQVTIKNLQSSPQSYYFGQISANSTSSYTVTPEQMEQAVKSLEQDRKLGSLSWWTDCPLNVRWFGAVGDDSNDDTTAFNACLAAALAAGPGGACILPRPAKAYRITSQLVVGIKYVNESDIVSSLTTITSAASYNSGNATAASNKNLIRILGDYSPIHCDFTSGGEQCALYLGIIRNGQINQKVEITGLIFLAQDEMTAGTFNNIAGQTAPTTNISGVFSGKLDIHLHHCQFWGMNRAVVMSDNYNSVVENNFVFRCNDGYTVLNNNAGRVSKNAAWYAQSHGFVGSGQQIVIEGCLGEECAVDVFVPFGNIVKVQNCYFEDVTVSNTSYSMIFGVHGAGANQCSFVELDSIHSSKSNGAQLFLAGSHAQVLNSQFYNTNVNSKTRLDDSLSTLRLMQVAINVDAAAPGGTGIAIFDENTIQTQGGLYLGSSSINGILDGTHTTGFQMGAEKVWYDVTNGNLKYNHGTPADQVHGQSIVPMTNQVSHNFGSVSNASFAVHVLSWTTGQALGDTVVVQPKSLVLPDGVWMWGQVKDANTVNIYVYNLSGGAFAGGAFTYQVAIWHQL